VAELVGEALADVFWPAQHDRSGVLHADDDLGGQYHALRVDPLDRLVEPAGIGDDLGLGGPGPGASIVAARGPHARQRRAEGIVEALFGGEQGEPAAGPQEPGGLAELDLRVDPVKRRARADQVE
jgi:hypothetical protein